MHQPSAPSSGTVLQVLHLLMLWDWGSTSKPQGRKYGDFGVFRLLPIKFSVFKLKRVNAGRDGLGVTIIPERDIPKNTWRGRKDQNISHPRFH